MKWKRTLTASFVFGLAIAVSLDLVGDMSFLTNWQWWAAVVAVCLGREAANAIEGRRR